MKILINAFIGFLFTPPVTCPSCGHWGQPDRMRCEVCGYDLIDLYD